MMKVCIITVNYNNSKLTCELSKNVLTLFPKNGYELYVVDNNSRENDKVNLDTISNSTVFFSKENTGYFQGVNLALKKINTSKFDYVVVCNNDITFHEDFYRYLVENHYNNDVYAVSPRIIDADGFDQNPMVENIISRKRVFFYDIYYKNYFFGQFIYKLWQKIKRCINKPLQADFSRYIFMGYGAVYILTKPFFEGNKILDTPPFIMGEEAFLANQINKSGGKIFFDHRLIVYHKDHSTCAKLPTKVLYNITKDSYKIYRNIILRLPPIDKVVG
jgi:Predicted glycosyltransferases